MLPRSPTSSLNNKNKIASHDNLGSDIIVGVENTPISSLPGTTIIPRGTGILPATASVTTLPGLVGGIKDDSSITSGSSGFGSLPKKKNEGTFTHSIALCHIHLLCCSSFLLMDLLTHCFDFEKFVKYFCALHTLETIEFDCELFY